jgi:glycosyltransferase involved in cell wall biosynthesis
MRIAWFSNAPWVPSGYGVQTGLMVPRIKSLGHDVCVIANCGLEGTVLDWNGIPVYPRAFGGIDAALIQQQIKDFGADIVISFYDAWPLSTNIMGPRWVPWFPVDREPMPLAVLNKVKDAFFGITCSQFGQDEAGTAGLHSMYAPCGVDTEAFNIMEPGEARRQLGFDEHTFIVAMVADNKGYPSRKALPQQIEAFARFHKQCPDSLLYLHSCTSTQRGGLDLATLVHYLGIQDAVVPCDQSMYIQGFQTEYLKSIYNAADVLCHVTMDEGFGVPIIEAQACGTKVIAGGWTSMPELVGAGYVINREDSEPWWNPTGGFQRVPHVAAIERALIKAYEERGNDVSIAARERACEYDANHVAKLYWGPILSEIEEKIYRESAQS